MFRGPADMMGRDVFETAQYGEYACSLRSLFSPLLGLVDPGCPDRDHSDLDFGDGHPT